jgi:arsenite oxidase small subunit
LPYPREGITKAGALQVNEPLTFQCPDPDSPCQILKAGRAVPGGIGPDGDIVAYSTTCTHMGCPLTHEKETRTYECGCHFCIVGCGCHVYKWPESREGGRAPDENALGLDYRKQLGPLSVIMTPAMHNVVTNLAE